MNKNKQYHKSEIAYPWHYIEVSFFIDECKELKEFSICIFLPTQRRFINIIFTNSF